MKIYDVVYYEESQTNYDHVVFLQNKPINAGDYQDAQDLINRKLCKSIEATIGDRMFVIGTGDGIILDGGRYYIDGQFIFDGIVFDFDDEAVTPHPIEATDGYFYVQIDTEGITYREDSNIALHDTVAGTYLESSERKRFTTSFIFSETPLVDTEGSTGWTFYREVGRYVEGVFSETVSRSYSGADFYNEYGSALANLFGSELINNKRVVTSPIQPAPAFNLTGRAILSQAWDFSYQISWGVQAVAAVGDKQFIFSNNFDYSEVTTSHWIRYVDRDYEISGIDLDDSDPDNVKIVVTVLTNIAHSSGYTATIHCFAMEYVGILMPQNVFAAAEANGWSTTDVNNLLSRDLNNIFYDNISVGDPVHMTLTFDDVPEGVYNLQVISKNYSQTANFVKNNIVIDYGSLGIPEPYNPTFDLQSYKTVLRAVSME